ncbi:hypothetical protein CBL_04569 [Carabus blaptoides fortunei]
MARIYITSEVQLDEQMQIGLCISRPLIRVQSVKKYSLSASHIIDSSEMVASAQSRLKLMCYTVTLLAIAVCRSNGQCDGTNNPKSLETNLSRRDEYNYGKLKAIKCYVRQHATSGKDRIRMNRRKCEDSVLRGKLTVVPLNKGRYVCVCDRVKRLVRLH